MSLHRLSFQVFGFSLCKFNCGSDVFKEELNQGNLAPAGGNAPLVNLSQSASQPQGGRSQTLGAPKRDERSGWPAGGRAESEVIGEAPLKLVRFAAKTIDRARVLKSCFASSEVVRLLVGYFERSLSRKRKAQLAGALIFPQNEQGARLYRRKLLYGLRPSEKLRLEAAALFPDNKRAAGLWTARVRSLQKLTLRERVELYACQSGLPEQAKALAERLFARLAPLYLKKQDHEAFRREVVNLAREELSFPGRTISSAGELANLFALPQGRIERYLRDLQGGLNPPELMQREQALKASLPYGAHALPQRLLQALRQLVSLENEMHRRGVISALSPREQFAELFGVSIKEIKTCLRLLPPQEWLYRERVFGNVARHELIQELITGVRRALTEWRNGGKKALQSDSTLAKRLKVQPVSIYHYLAEALDKNEQRLRDTALREQLAAERHLRSVLAFVRQEIQAFHAGEINRLFADEELGAVFNLSPIQVRERLNVEGSGLTPSAQRFRDFVLNLQKPEDVVSYAMRQEWLQFMTDRIERKARRYGERPLSPDNVLALAPCRRRRTRPRSLPAIRQKYGYHVVYQGVTYGSYEEAALGTLMGRYLGLELVSGKTVQVMVANHAFDFFLPADRLLVEYHPLVLINTSRKFGAFKNKESYENYLAMKSDPSLSERRKRRITAETKHELYREYAEERRSIMRSDPRYKDCRLIVVVSPESFYERVIAFAALEVPSKETFLNDYRRQLYKVKRDSSLVNPWMEAAKKGAG